MCIEYIGQLEGEIAAKTAEADELRAKNQALTSENTRLTDLTRMLLESPAFSAFLDEMSGAEKHTSRRPQQEMAAPKVEESRQNCPKDVDPHQPSQQVQSEQDNAQVGLALLPEPYINFNTGNTTWAENIEFGLYDAQVYAVTSMPEGPAVDQFDAVSLSGKPTGLPICFASEVRKQDAPVIEHPLASIYESRSQTYYAEDTDKDDSQLAEFDSAYALYDEEVSEPLKSMISGPQDILLSSILLEKPADLFEMTIVDDVSNNGVVDGAAVEKFMRFCAIMEDVSQRVASVTSHL